MPATNADIGFGASVEYGDGGSPENFTVIGEVLDIEGPEITTSPVDATNQQSPGGYKEKIYSLLDGGQVTFEVNMIPDNATQDHVTGLRSIQKARTVKNFRVVAPDTKQFALTFPAIVESIGQSLPMEDKMVNSITLTVAGEITESYLNP